MNTFECQIESTLSMCICSSLTPMLNWLHREPITVRHHSDVLPYQASTFILFYYADFHDFQVSRMESDNNKKSAHEQDYQVEPLLPNENCCVICHKPASQVEKLRKLHKGLQKILDYSLRVRDDVLYQYLQEGQQKGKAIRIHENCQKYVYNELKRKSSANKRSASTKGAKLVTRASVTRFDWKQNCFFCGEPCAFDEKHPGRNRFRLAETLPFRDKVLNTCQERNDIWAEDVKRRVVDCLDFVAAEARYHKACSEKFFSYYSVLKSPPNRPTDTVRFEIFKSVCDWLESEGEVYSVSEIHAKMIEIAGDADYAYSKRWLKHQLQKKYGDHIFFVKLEGKSDVVCFRQMADYLVKDLWSEDRKENAEEEGRRIIRTAAKLLLGDIRDAKYDYTSYPTTEELESVDYGLQWLPPFLRLFMECLTNNTLKQSSIGQVLVHLIRPRSLIPPTLFGLAVELDHVFGSTWLTSELSRLGFCLGVEEVTRYKQSVVENESVTDFLSTVLPGAFTQWSADNVDHNVRTIDGKGTFHGMGLVCCSTGRNQNLSKIRSHRIKRQALKLAGDVTKAKGIPVFSYYPEEESGLSQLEFKPRIQLMMPISQAAHTSLDLLWHTALFFKGQMRPSWSGYMSKVCSGEYPGKSTVTFLPIIDLDPNDMSCIYSTILYVISQAKHLAIKTPVLTFDQPLWIKAIEIAQAKSLDIVLILGGFHLMMSYVGSIGFLMKGSGIQEALLTIYGTNAVEHMLTGKAIAKALRGHFLIESAVATKLLEKFFPFQPELLSSAARQSSRYDVGKPDDMEINPRDASELNLDKEIDSIQYDVNPTYHSHCSQLSSDKTEELSKLYTSAELSDHAIQSESLQSFQKQITEYKDRLRQSSRTSKLWLQYLSYVEVLKLYIFAARTGNWHLHLEAVNRMLNLLAATGHIHYAKSARLYLQNMLELPNRYPSLYRDFAENGYHTVRRSDKFWAGLWSDLIIEQVLMRSLKARGGMTRGRGLSESVRVLWTNSMHRCASVHNAMSNLTGMQHKTSEQHVELSSARIARDNSDLLKLLSWFSIRNPFDGSKPQLQCLASGIIATEDDGLNCDEAEAVGFNIQSQLDGVCIDDAKLKRKDHVKTLETLRPGVKIANTTVHVDPAMLFTRLTAILCGNENASMYFDYEMTAEPTALFKNGIMRKPTKSTFRNFLLDKIPPSKEIAFNSCVIDGGALLHRVYWPPNSVFKDIFTQYSTYVQRHYRKYHQVNVVFDGYMEGSTKSQEQMRRGSKTAPNIDIQDEAEVPFTREVFLRNPSNKHNLIQVLMKHLRADGLNVIQSASDADVSIVQRSIECATHMSVVVHADDTDILVLLIYHWKANLKSIHFCTERCAKASASRGLKYWSIEALAEAVHNKKLILFAHAWSGCDTTSALHQKGNIHYTY